MAQNTPLYLSGAQPLKLSVIPMRDTVVFPHMVMTLFVGRTSSIQAVDHALESGADLFLVLQKDPKDEKPDIEKGLYRFGVIAGILQVINLPDGTLKVLVEGKRRAIADHYAHEEGIIYGYVEGMALPQEPVPHTLVDTLVQNFVTYANYNKRISSDFISALTKEKEPSKILDMVCAKITLDPEAQQDLLSTLSLEDRLEKVLSILLLELDALKIEERVHRKVKQELERKHREYYLNEQMKAIQSELNKEGDQEHNELEILKKRIQKKKFSPEVKKKAETELRKLSQMNPMSSEASIVRGYLEWLLDIPWNERSRLTLDLNKAHKTLDRDHHGLEKVKERILELLAVQKRLGKASGQVICFLGPPGVGKTSLGQSIAEATGREFVKVSLGGVRDEAEIRGHRRTYIGAMPGRIIQGMKKAKKSNPVILLDEIDKLGADWRGDPSSALLEVLDPSQNKAFNDHYLEVDYDLSEVLFIATANSLNLPRPLIDRMEIVQLSGYTEEEKLAIAQDHLLPKVRQKTGLQKREFTLSEPVVRDLIRHYTRESGVRGLERELSALARKSLREIMEEDKKSNAITLEKLHTYLGPPRYEHEKAQKKPQVGVTSGLSWSEVGGDLLLIEAAMSYGKGKIISTGKLGEVMQESVKTAHSFIRSRASRYGIHPNLFMERDLHVHAPAGAIPKDGPSAGIAISTSLVSVLTGIPVRSDVAMTGEITLSGRVLPIGGLKEKLLAAVRGGIKTVFIPAENKKDMHEMPKNVTEALEIQYVSDFDEVVQKALTKAPKPLETLEFDAPKRGKEPSIEGLSSSEIVYTPKQPSGRSKPI